MMVGDIRYDVYIFISGVGEGWRSCGNLLGTISKESYTLVSKIEGELRYGAICVKEHGKLF